MCLFFADSVYAGHGSGVDITYECTGPCTIRLHFKAYRGCYSSIPVISPVNTLNITSGTGCNAPVPLDSAWINVSNTEVTPVCPGTPTLCNSTSATLAGVEEHYWIRDYDFCAANCSNYLINWSICCRNTAITTLNSPTTTTMYVETVINPLITPCNSSPVFDNAPTPYICEGQSYIFSQGATDIDGDSLAYQLGPCLSGQGQQVPYTFGYSPQNPLGGDWTLELDSITGDLSILPNPLGANPGSIQVGVICIYVQEWRNGVLINTVMRDIQLTVIACPNNTQPVIPGALNVQGGTANGFQVASCLGATVCWYVRANDPDLGQTQTITWDQSLASSGATLVMAGNPSITDTIVGNNVTAVFCWTPPAAGTYNFTVTITDDACPLYGFNQYTYTLQVTEHGVLVSDSVLGCDLASFCATPLAGIPPFNFSWTGAGGLNQTDSCFSFNYPGPGNWPYQLTLTDSAGCISNYTDTLNITNPLIADAGSDDTICAGQIIQLGTSPTANPNLVFEWSPPAHLSDSSLAQPDLDPVNQSGLPEIQSFALLVHDTSSHCFAFDSVDILVNPIPNSAFIFPTAICQDDSATMTYAGFNSAQATYLWTFDQGSPAIGTGQGPHSVFWNNPGNHEVTLTVYEYGCTSPVHRDTIRIKETPVASIGPVAAQCFDGHLFNLLNLGSYGPLASFQWQLSPGANPTADTTEHLSNLTFISPGTYFASLQIFEEGCISNVDSLEITLHPQPDASWSFTSNGICFPINDFNFHATGINDSSAQYAWTFEDGNPPGSNAMDTTVNFVSQGPKSVTLTVTALGCSSSVVDTLEIFPSPSVDAGADSSFCEGDTGIQLLGMVTGGNPAFTWTWWCNSSAGLFAIDSAQTDHPFVWVEQSAWVYVQVVDDNSCSSETDSLWIDVLPKPLIQTSPDTSICYHGGPCVNLSATILNPGGPYSIFWTPAAGLSNPFAVSPCANPDSTTTYTFNVIDLNTGCSSNLGGSDSSAMTEVEVRPLPIVTAGIDQELCPGEDTQLSATASAAGPTYQYQWSPQTGLSNPFASNPVASPAISTVYSVVASSNGCFGAADTIQITVHSLPIADAGQDIQICLGESVRLDGSAGGDSTATFSFNWSQAVDLDDPSLEDPIATPQITTTYFITATSSWGCVSYLDSVTVHLQPTPIANAGDSAFVCLGDYFQFQSGYFYGQTDSASNASLIYYDWSPGLELNDSTLVQPGFIPNHSGWYEMRVSYQGCQTIDSVFLTSIPHLNPSIWADTTVTCQGDSVLLQAGGGLSNPNFQWVPSAGLSDPFSAMTWAAPDISTTYQVFLEEYGCQDSFQISLEILPRPEASFAHTSAIACPPLDVYLVSTSSLASNLIWNFGDGSPVSNFNEIEHQYSQAGIYPLQLLAVSPGGCLDSSEVLWVEVTPPPRMNVLSQPEIPCELYLPQAELHLSENYGEVVQWQWEMEDLRQLSRQEIAYQFQNPGTYFVKLKGVDEKGCWNDTLIGPIVVFAPDLFIPNVFSPDGDGINDRFLVDYQGGENFLLQIFDRWGKLLYESRNKLQGWNGETSQGNPVSEGTFYFYIGIGQQDYTGKLDLIR